MGFSRQEYWSGVPLPSPTIPSLAGACWAQTEDPSGCGAASPSQGRWDPDPLRPVSGASQVVSVVKNLPENVGNVGLILGWEDLPQPEKDLESRSSTPLEARCPCHDSSAMTRSPSTRPWRPDFPVTTRETP